MWGLGRVIGLEDPRGWGGLVDLPEVTTARCWSRLCNLLAGKTAEDQFAIRSAGVLVRRLVREPCAAAIPAIRHWAPGGTVLITGGTGALGGHVARWLVHTYGAVHLLLVSRSGMDAAGAVELVDQLRAGGGDVTVAACDVTDAAVVAEVLQRIPIDHPLDAVFHVAGISQLSPLAAVEEQLVVDELGPKLRGTQVLAELVGDRALSAFVMFSSGAGVWGGSGQGVYAAANAFLDAFAENRRALGWPALAIAWGAWAGDGMVSDAAGAMLERIGVKRLAPEIAIEALQDALNRSVSTLTVADVDWDRFYPTFASARPRPFLHEIAEVKESIDNSAKESTSALAERLQGLAPDAQQALLLGLVCTQAGIVLGHPSDDIDPERAFQDLGFDSLTAIELRNRLKTATGLALSPTLIFDYPTPAALAGYLGQQLSGSVSVVGPAALVPVARVGVDELVAVVGVGCRFPGGVDSAEGLWGLVVSGGDVVSGFPTDRGWDVEGLFDPDPDVVGKSYTRWGGFLTDAAGFDAGFFGIGPSEALAMDPQQRLLLEVCWEALEQAGIDPVSLRGSPTGVFVGILGGDYGVGATADEGLEGYRLTGSLSSVASGRVAYVLGLEGPAVSVDTACSSSLVALHLAVQSLRLGECDLALAGGVTVMATPTGFVEFSRQRGLAADGRCKAFAGAADGVGWSEGAGVVVVERLSDARRWGHSVLAVVRGSAVNQDGASNGLTAPNGPSQQRVIRAALANAGLGVAEVDVVEAHGTGTTLGDPIEAQALLATYGQDRPQDQPLWLGSIKSNLGHASAAAGVAGVIKMVQAMRHQVMPATLHVDEPSPHVDWSAGSVSLLTQARPWVEQGHPRRAGISSFGISGTNAHVILEQAPVEDVVEVAEKTGGAGDSGQPGSAVGVGLSVVPWVVSGKSAAALAGQAEALLAHVQGDEQLDPVDVGWSLAGRSTFEHRAVVIGEDRQQLMGGLAGLAAGQPGAGVVVGQAQPGGKTVLVFSGQGSQWLGMGRELCAQFPVFAKAFDAVADELDQHVRLPLRQVVWGADEGLLDSTEFAQPALFAVEVALARLLECWGVVADVVMGHSVGEITAAHVAGVLSLEDAAVLVAARGRLMAGLAAGGAMVAVAASEHEVAPLLGQDVEVAAINGPQSVVISGEQAALSAIVEGLAQQGRRVHQLAVSHAFHSSLMEPMVDEFARVAADVVVGEPRVAVVSNVTGELVGPGFGSAQYWADHVRRPVRFAQCVRVAESLGGTRFVEVGPGGGLTAAIEQSLASPGEAVCVGVLGKDRPEVGSVLGAAGRLFTCRCGG